MNSSIKHNNFKINRNSHNKDLVKKDTGKVSESEIILSYNAENSSMNKVFQNYDAKPAKNYNVNVNIKNIYNNNIPNYEKDGINMNNIEFASKERIFSVGNSPNRGRLEHFHENKNIISNSKSEIGYMSNFMNSKENSPLRHVNNPSRVITSVTEYIDEKDFSEICPTSIIDQVSNIENNENKDNSILNRNLHNNSNNTNIKSELLNYNKFSTQLKKNSEEKHLNFSNSNNNQLNINSNLNNTYNKPNSNINSSYSNNSQINSSLMKNLTNKPVQFNINSKGNLNDNVNLINNNNSEEHPYLKNKSLLRSSNMSPNEGFIYNRASVSRMNNLSSSNLRKDTEKESNSNSNNKIKSKNIKESEAISNAITTEDISNVINNTSPSEYINVKTKMKNIYECDDISISCKGKGKEKLGLSIKEINKSELNTNIKDTKNKNKDSENSSTKKTSEVSGNISIDLTQMMDPEEIHFMYIKFNKHSKYNLSKFEAEFTD